MVTLFDLINNDAWLSLVERCVRDAEVAGSNPVASIDTKIPLSNDRGIFVSVLFIEVEPATSIGVDARSGAEGSRGPGDLGFEPTGAERRPQVQILSIFKL